MKKFTTAALAASALSALLITGGTASAFAAEPETSGNVDVSVEIAKLTEPGFLAMTVAGSATTLAENGSTVQERVFTGTLPEITVTDTRAAEEIPEGAAWYVVGSASAFTGDAGQPEIAPGHLGWVPALIDGDDAGLVSEGDRVDTVLDEGGNAVGLVGQELLAMSSSSAEVATGDTQWTATADLFLKTAADVAPGNYTSTVTLSLFE